MDAFVVAAADPKEKIINVCHILTCVGFQSFFIEIRMIASLKGSNHQISEEERMVRNHEMELLTKISAPPGRDGDHLEILVKNRKKSLKGA